MKARQEEAEKALTDQTNLLPRAKLLVVFGCMSLALLITFIDQNGISVTLPTIGRSLDATSTISWAGTSSLIANTFFSMLYGRLSDIFGRKSVMISTLLLLSMADLLCGLAQNGPMFYVFRGLAGAAGGGTTNLTMMIVSDIVTLEQRGKYQGIIGAMVGIGNAAGPFIAAAFIQRGSSASKSDLAEGWRGFFYLLSPCSAICAAVVWKFLPGMQKKKDDAGKEVLDWKQNIMLIDWKGLFAVAVAVIFILIPVSGGGLYFAWDSPLVISMLVIGGVALIIFVVIEWKWARLPMMPVGLYSNGVITVMLIQSFLLGASYQSFLYYLPLYYQNVRQWSAVLSAALTCPLVVMQSIFSILSGQYISRKKRYGEIVWIGFGLWTLGAGLTILFDLHTHPAVCAVILCVVGMGVGFIFQPTLVALQAHAPKSQRAVIIGNRNFFRCLGGACGLAVSAAILQSTLKANLPPEFKGLVHSTYSLSDRAALESSVTAAQWSAIENAYMKASRAVFILQAPMMGVCFIGCLFIKDRGLVRPEEKKSEPPQAVSNEASDGEESAESDKSAAGIRPADKEE